jgi:hypothetical protein
MRRISSLPTAEFCPKADSFGEDIESTNALRSTVFHKYAETGTWPEDIKRLPDSDVEEIKKWKVPEWLKVKDGDNEIKVHYRDAQKEVRVALDEDFNYIDVPSDVPINEVASKYPGVMSMGHLDMAWDIPSLDLVIVSDIKSSVFAVKARTKSLQLHGYGIGFARKLGRSRYIVDIWDACDGLHYLDNEIIKLDSFECEEYKGRIREASKNRDGGFVRGSHCSGCWKRDSCPAHIVDVQETDNRFAKVLSGKCSEADVREALIAAKGLQSLYAKVKDACESWAVRHGPVRSEDGLKCWRPALRSGKKSLDQAAVAEALGKEDLKEFMVEGNPFQVFDWVNVKK